MGIKITNEKFPVKNLLAMVDNGEINFEMAIQRNYVWKNDQASGLVDSILQGMPIPPVLAWPKDGSTNDGVVYEMMDGKQRLTTVMRFLKDEFKIEGDEIDPITFIPKKGAEAETFNMVGKKFSEFPPFLQSKILNFDFECKVARKDALETRDTDELQEEIFRRQNSGSSLTKMELTTALASGKVMEFINEICDTHFFKNVANIPGTWRVRQTDKELVLQIGLLFSKDGEAAAIDGNSLRKFAVGMKEEGFPDELANRIRKVTEYVGAALPDYSKDFKKAHVPMIFMMAEKAIKAEISPVKFGGWVQSFFVRSKANTEKQVCRYNSASVGGTAKKEKVAGRLEGITKDYDKYIWDAGNYEAPATPAPAGAADETPPAPETPPATEKGDTPAPETPNPETPPAPEKGDTPDNTVPALIADANKGDGEQTVKGMEQVASTEKGNSSEKGGNPFGKKNQIVPKQVRQEVAAGSEKQ